MARESAQDAERPARSRAAAGRPTRIGACCARLAVTNALNSGRLVEGAFALAVLLPTLLFLAARSLIGFARWRLQRELWRRDVERLQAGE